MCCDLEVAEKSLAQIHQAGSLAEAGAWAPTSGKERCCLLTWRTCSWPGSLEVQGRRGRVAQRAGGPSHGPGSKVCLAKPCKA